MAMIQAKAQDEDLSLYEALLSLLDTPEIRRTDAGNMLRQSSRAADLSIRFRWATLCSG